MAEEPAPYSRRENDPLIRFLQGLNIGFGRLYHQVTLRSQCPLPATGPAILVCNHLSGLDPVLIQSVCPRLIRWMMAREYYHQKSLKWLLDLLGVIPVARSGRDSLATRLAVRALESGYILGIFPEGKIETTLDLLPFQDGPVMLAGRTGAPVFPAYIEGTQRRKPMLPAYFTRNRCTLTFGQEMHFTRQDLDREHWTQSTARLWAAMEQLRQREHSRYQNHSPFAQVS